MNGALLLGVVLLVGGVAVALIGIRRRAGAWRAWVEAVARSAVARRGPGADVTERPAGLDPALPAPVDDSPTGATPTTEPVAYAGPEPVLDEPVGATPPVTADPDAEMEPAPADPPRESHAELACADVVVAGQPFPVRVGLRPDLDPAVAGTPLRRPESSRGPWTLTVQLVAEGFSLEIAAERWRVDLEVTAADPYPTATLSLVATAGAADAPVMARSLRAMYLADGQPIGFAVRAVAVVNDPALLAVTPAPPPEDATILAPPTADAPADITVRIELADGSSPGRLLWQLLAADPAVTVPDAPIAVDIGREPEAFLRRVIVQMTEAEGRPGLYQALRGIGRLVADQIPGAFWTVLADVAARTPGRAVTVLLLSAEPYVPWELAVLDDPLDPEAPPFLSAQVDLGRWILAPRRPTLPPPFAVEARTMAVVSGVYDRDPAWQRLLDAEAEAGELVDRYRAVAVEAECAPVLALLEGSPRADVLHFAVHGQYDPGGTIDGLVLLDGPLDPLQVTGSDLAGHPFVFLNACQVGSGDAVLGDHAGMARAFLSGGAAGVVAPLWSIDDIVARELALRFYARTLAGATPAEALREERRSFRRDPPASSSTMLAYQLFGHPRMVLRPSGPLAGSVERGA